MTHRPGATVRCRRRCACRFGCLARPVDTAACETSGGPAARDDRSAPCAHLGAGGRTRRWAWRPSGATLQQAPSPAAARGSARSGQSSLGRELPPPRPKLAGRAAAVGRSRLQWRAPFCPFAASEMHAERPRHHQQHARSLQGALRETARARRSMHVAVGNTRSPAYRQLHHRGTCTFLNPWLLRPHPPARGLTRLKPSLGRAAPPPLASEPRYERWVKP